MFENRALRDLLQRNQSSGLDQHRQFKRPSPPVSSFLHDVKRRSVFKGKVNEALESFSTLFEDRTVLRWQRWYHGFSAKGCGASLPATASTTRSLPSQVHSLGGSVAADPSSPKTAFFARRFGCRHVRCDNARCNSNGKRVMVAALLIAPGFNP
jgi:hypothetical protein